jgi:hypothetical protein
LADGVFVGEILAGEHLVNHHDLLSLLIVLLGEKAALLEGNVEHVQVAGIASVNERHIHLATISGLRLAFTPKE